MKHLTVTRPDDDIIWWEVPKLSNYYSWFRKTKIGTVNNNIEIFLYSDSGKIQIDGFNFDSAKLSKATKLYGVCKEGKDFMLVHDIEHQKCVFREKNLTVDLPFGLTYHFKLKNPDKVIGNENVKSYTKLRESIRRLLEDDNSSIVQNIFSCYREKFSKIELPLNTFALTEIFESCGKNFIDQCNNKIKSAYEGVLIDSVNFRTLSPRADRQTTDMLDKLEWEIVFAEHDKVLATINAEIQKITKQGGNLNE